MIDEQHVFYSRLRCDEPGAIDRLQELDTPRDIRTPSVTSVILAYMRSRGDDEAATVVESAMKRIISRDAPADAMDALSDFVFFYENPDDDLFEYLDDELLKDKDAGNTSLRYLRRVAGMPEKHVPSSASPLTPLYRRLLGVMLRHDARATFEQLREAWDDDVEDDTIETTLKRLRKRLPRSQWYFEISVANHEVIWHKKGQSVP